MKYLICSCALYLYTVYVQTELQQQEAELSLNRSSAIAMIENEEKRVDVTLLLRDKPEINEDVLKKYDDADVDVGSDGFDSSRSGRIAIAYIYTYIYIHVLIL